MSNRNLQTVQAMYAAFAHGDIPSILAHLDDDVLWEYDKPDKPDAGIPWLKPRKGRAEVPKFFAALAELDELKFQPKTLMESGNIVVSLSDVSYVIRATGKALSEEDEVHIWHFNASGKVTKFCHKTDTQRQWAALRLS